MSPEEKLKGLLRLKNFETPPEGFLDDIVADFHKRQRQELMQRGSFSILWERVSTWFDFVRRPAFVWAASGAYAALMLLVCLWPKPQRTTASTNVIVNGGPQVVAPAKDPLKPAPPIDRSTVPVSNKVLEPTGTKQKSVDEEPTVPPTGKTLEL